jgi:hypothetical protein
MTKDLTTEELDSIQKRADLADGQLASETEWIVRYKGYADEIFEKVSFIEKAKKQFREWRPLFLYTNISTTKSATKNKVDFNLRYQGQAVANLHCRKDQKIKLKIYKNTKKFFGYEPTSETDTCDWDSPEAKAFRAHFRKYPARIDGKKRNVEHRYESALLTELSKDKGEDKAVTMIQPVLLLGNRFQMPTPFSASTTKKLGYGKQDGGGIDLLCRTKHGKSTINIFELKDEYEDPVGVLKQAVVYAAFIRRLLRTPEAGSKKWWELFGFENDHSTETTLKINVVAALPHAQNEKEFSVSDIKIGDDTLQLHYFYFDIKDANDQVSNVKTTIK